MNALSFFYVTLVAQSVDSRWIQAARSTYVFAAYRFSWTRFSRISFYAFGSAFLIPLQIKTWIVVVEVPNVSDEELTNPEIFNAFSFTLIPARTISETSTELVKDAWPLISAPRQL